MRAETAVNLGDATEEDEREGEDELGDGFGVFACKEQKGT